ncbi:MAG: hypothetical protein HOV79_07345 [Hamadaea sp.]|nr:hypothetical protein [Hamadaea sp.]
MREPAGWLAGDRDPGRFPYAEVMAQFHRTGKHFADKDLLVQLDRARRTAPADHGPGRRLRDFLDVALDKFDGRYDYQTYLGLRLLPLPQVVGGPGRDDEVVRREHDELILQLVADAIGFETAAAGGTTDLLPVQRPAPQLVEKRCRLAVRAVAAQTRDQAAGQTPDPIAATARLCEAAAARRTDEQRWALTVSMQPVDRIHDEYLFIRVLQGYESTFAVLAAELGQAVDDLDGARAADAARRLRFSADLLDRSAPLFSLMATVRAESFQAFRVYTEGASAIQSRSYKRVEALCRTPRQDRLDSAAYRSVPEVRDEVLGGRRSLDEVYRSAVASGPDRRLLDEAMTQFATALLRWRRTHHRIAVRMLGTRPGTGYTEGTPYLAAVRDIPVFSPGADPAEGGQPS